jgi:aminoglycoside phosphotransferase (APT) family kinase protein
VVKRALARLKVKEPWLADAGRNYFEQLYLAYVGKFLPRAVPAIRMASKEHGYFAMEYFGSEFTNWKELLMQGQVETAHARMAGQTLGTIHHHSAGDAAAAKEFDTTANFHQLRVDPYLLSTAREHPKLRKMFEAEAERLEATRICLVHGDFSPKNMLINKNRLVLLDCEVAWYGDPAFDAAFLLNHLFLKALLHAPREIGFDRMVHAFWSAYAKSCQDAFDLDELEARVVRLLLMLMLARVDGKSPVEYLKKQDRKNVVRDFVRRKLVDKRLKLSLAAAAWFAILKELK